MKVSVVIPFYNRTHLLRTCIASALAQTRPADEIIVVDDCSPENTEWLTKEFPTVRLIRLSENGGPPRARYHGAAAATGTHIATLDSDDYWYPEKLEKQIAFVEKTGDLRGIYSHLQWVEENDMGGIRPTVAPRPGEPFSEYLYVRNGFLQSNTLLIERQLYLETCRFSENEFLEDSEMIIVADARNHPVYLQDESLSHWNCTLDPGRVSNNRWEQRLHDHFELVGGYFTPRARAAFEGRNLAPCLARRGEFLVAARMIIRAVWARAFSPSTALKVTLNSFCPVSYRWIQAQYSRLRTHRPDAAHQASALS